MENEFIDILTKEGKPTGKSCTKSEIHSQGHYHNTAHVWFYTKDGQILLAQRAAKKTLHPLLWDVSVAGHVDADETVEEGAIREVFEEIGLKILNDDLHKIGVYECFQTYDSGIIDNEFHHTYIIELQTELDNLRLQKDEVESIKLVDFEEFQFILDHIGTENHFVPSNKRYYEKVFDAIQKQLTCF